MGKYLAYWEPWLLSLRPTLALRAGLLWLAATVLVALVRVLPRALR